MIELRSIKVLVIEDNPVDARLIQFMLEERADAGTASTPRFEVEIVDGLEEGLARLNEGGIHLILLDLTLGPTRGLETFDRVFAHSPHVPIVVLSGSDDERQALEAVKRGAQDYLLKGHVDALLLTRSIRYALERHAYREEREAHAQELSRHVHALTEGFREVSAGNFRVRIAEVVAPESSDSELNYVVESFDEMMDQLEHLTELRTKFYSMVTHDLRSPLSAILLLVHSLSRPGASEPEKSEWLDVLRRKVKHMLSLVDSLLEVLFIRSTAFSLQYEEVVVQELFAACAAEAEARLEERDQVLQIDAGPAGFSFEADPVKLARIVENLISNASKYSGEGARIQLRAGPDGADSVAIEVRDQGPGITLEDRDHIFEPFFRAKAHRSAVTGTGLGLSICKDFVEAHGGTISVECPEEGGTVFTVKLPSRSQKRARDGRDSA